MTSNNAPDLMRSQLLSGQSPLVVVNRPLTADDIGTSPADTLTQANLTYAPLANTGLVIGYVLSTAAGERRDLRITPRLLAKLMTQSYAADITWFYGRWQDSVPLYRQGRPRGIVDDPEWLALGNPTFYASEPQNSPFVVVGPQGDDAIRLLWQNVQSDADAAAFLRASPTRGG